MDIIYIAKKIEKYGGRLYLVGGALRDSLLGLQPKDYDYCVTGIERETFEEIFPNAKIQEKSFPVFTMDNIEFAMARVEKKVSNGHKGFEMLTNSKISIEEDLKRRDITINSIAKDVLTEEIIDPFNRSA